MDNVTMSDVTMLKIAIDNYSEEKVEHEIIISDYSASVGKIIRCDATPVVISKTIEKEKLTILGICEINVIYCDEESGNIKSVTERVPFEKIFRADVELSNCRVISKIRVNNILARQINSKKINVKVILGIATKMMGNEKVSIISEISDNDIETANNVVEHYIYSNCTESDISVSGEVNAPHMPIDVIKTYATVDFKDIKPINDKIIIKGEVQINAIYTYGDSVSDLEIAESKIPFTEVIDAETSEEDSKINLDAVIKGLKCYVEEENIAIECDLIISALIYNPVKYYTISDLYSKKNNVTVSTKNIVIESLNEKIEFKDRVSDKFDFEFKEARIVNMNCQPTVKNISYNDGVMIVDCDVNVTVYAYNDEEYKIADKTLSYSIEKTIEIGNDTLRCEAKVESDNISYIVVNDEQIELSMDLLFTIDSFTKNDYNVVDNFIVEPDEAVNNFSSKVIIYYAQQGETLWEIAKKFRTSVEALKCINDIDSSGIHSDRVLLVSKS